jgi:uncharacterized repeat protein (TIGR03803 family)
MAGDRLLLAVLFVLWVGAGPAIAQTFRVLYKFSGAGDGYSPQGSIIRDVRGNLYGVTAVGGAFDDGVVFRLDRAAKESVLHSFTAADGSQPEAGLIRDTEGSLYGTTTYGGTPEGGGCRHGCGTVFKIDRTDKETVLYAFTGKADGGIPSAALILDRAGDFYGTTVYGGKVSSQNFGYGVVFKLNNAGKETVLHSFSGGTDGAFPSSALTRDRAGNLYGTTLQGGDAFCGYPPGCGVVFKLDQTGKETVLHRFTADPDGEFPTTLIRDGAGNLYGITEVGGKFSCIGPGCGVVFKLDKLGRETVLYSFTGGADGAHPSSLIRDSMGNLYGTTLSGGKNENGCPSDGCGVVFKLDAGGRLTVLHSFTGTGGSYPAGLTMDGAGNFHGTAILGGKPGCGGYGCGVIFKLAPLPQL